MRRTDSLEKTLMLGKIEGVEGKWTTENEMVGWHYQLDGHKFEQALRGGDGQGNLGLLQSMELQRLRHDLATEQQ